MGALTFRVISAQARLLPRCPGAGRAGTVRATRPFIFEGPFTGLLAMQLPSQSPGGFNLP